MKAHVWLAAGWGKGVVDIVQTFEVGNMGVDFDNNFLCGL